MHEEERLKLPVNVKQIGSIADGLRVYIEDYVYTYIQQYAGSAGCDEKIGILAGKKYNIDNCDALFISGAIQGKFSREESGMETLTDRSWEYIDKQMNTYFKGLNIVGWIYIQPGYGEYINSNLRQYHKKYFKEDFDVLFISDPMERTNGFFCQNEVLNSLEMLKGYFIYYDKNEGMHEYMLENRLVKVKGDSASESGASLIEDKVREEINPKPRTIRQKGKALAEQRRMVNLLGSLSAVLFLVCFIMGAGLIQNDGRIDELENKLAAINNSYTYLINQLKEGNVASVFAAQDENGANIQSAQNAKEEITEKEEQVKVESQTQTQEPSTEAEPETQAEAQTAKPEVKAENTSAAKKQADIPDTYVVQEGDTLSLISQRIYGTKNMTDAIMQENQLENPDMIYYGKVLYLPKS